MKSPAQVLVYNLREEHVQALTAPGTGERVHITIAPREKPNVSGPNKPQGATPTPGADRNAYAKHSAAPNAAPAGAAPQPATPQAAAQQPAAAPLPATASAPTSPPQP